MPFGIPSEDFHGGFGLPHDDDYDPYTGKYAFVSPDDDDDDVSDTELEAAAEEAHDNLVRSLIEAGGEIRELKEVLRETKEALFYMLVLHDSSHGHNMLEAVPILYQLQSDSGWTVQKAQEIFKKVSEYCEESKL